MPWKQQGGGGGPWGSGPSGGGPQPPDLDEILRKGQERFRRMMPGGIGTGKGIALIGLIILGIWLFSGVYRVQPGEQGVELLFGKFVKQTGPGLHFWAPRPIGEVFTPNVARTNAITVGYRVAGAGPSTSARDVQGESLMLTGDQNIIDIDFVVQWNIKDASNFLFNVRDPVSTTKLAAESAIREVVGQTSLEDALAARREDVEIGTKGLLQNILDNYGSGIFVIDVKMQKVEPPQQVIDAFDDVQRARQDKEREQNEAAAYSNDIIPRAQGEAARMVQEATAYRERVVKEAEGEAQRFLSVYEAYKGNREVTTRRLFLERMQEVLKGANKVIIEGGQGGQGVVPYLPLPEIQRRSQAGQAGQTSGGGR